MTKEVGEGGFADYSSSEESKSGSDSSDHSDSEFSISKSENSQLKFKFQRRSSASSGKLSDEEDLSLGEEAVGVCVSTELVQCDKKEIQLRYIHEISKK